MNEIANALKDHSAEYSQKVTELSDRLEAIEKFLQSMPGKIETSIDINPEEHIGFHRDGQTWRLIIHAVSEDEGSGTSYKVTDAPIAIKALAARHVPRLIDSIIYLHRQRVKEIDAGLEGLDTLPLWSNEDTAKKEGK